MTEENILFHEFKIISLLLELTGFKGKVQNTLFHLINNSEIFLHVELSVKILFADKLNLVLENHVGHFTRYDIFDDIRKGGHDILPEVILSLHAQLLALLDDTVTNIIAQGHLIEKNTWRASCSAFSEH